MDRLCPHDGQLAQCYQTADQSEQQSDRAFAAKKTHLGGEFNAALATKWDVLEHVV